MHGTEEVQGSLFSKYVSNLVGCKVAYMYISTKIYDREANLASW